MPCQMATFLGLKIFGLFSHQALADQISCEKLLILAWIFEAMEAMDKRK